MMWKLLLDVLPADGSRPIRHHVIKPEIIKADTSVVDTANVENATDTVAAAQDFVVGGASGGDDMTMLFASVFVVLFALALCLYFVFAYRRSLRPGVK